MAQLTKAERLDKVKTALGFGGNSYQDSVLEIYIDDAIDFLVSSGVNEEVATSAKAIGAIIIYVNDTYNYSAGDVKYSDALVKRVVQLATEVI